MLLQYGNVASWKLCNVLETKLEQKTQPLVNRQCVKLQQQTSNVSVGNYSMKDSTTGNDNVAVGYCSLKDNTTGCRNVAVGRCALHASDTGLEQYSSWFLKL